MGESAEEQGAHESVARTLARRLLNTAPPLVAQPVRRASRALRGALATRAARRDEGQVQQPSVSAELGTALAATAGPASQARERYLELMKRCLMGLMYEDQIGAPPDRRARMEGMDWPSVGHTMIGRKRLDNIQFCVEDVLTRGVPGDLMETGVWRGGASIFMRAVLQAHGAGDRHVWVADSFAGLPPPDTSKYPQDTGIDLYLESALAISLEVVQANFARYDLLDPQVHFLKGWFRDTLPQAPNGSLAVLRLDGDLYESTMDSLVNLYPKLSVGGYVIVDDYGAVDACRQAVADYRRMQGIDDGIVTVDWAGSYWRRSR